MNGSTGYTEAIRVARRVTRLAETKQLSLLAAGVAFFAFFSLVPLSLLGLVVATVVGGDQFVAEVTSATSEVLTPSARMLLAEALTEGEGRGGATAVGAVGLLWSGARVLRGLDHAFSEVYGTFEETTFLGSFRNAAIVTLAISLGVLAVAGAEAILGAATGGVVTLIAPLFVLLTLLVLFLPVYIVFPSAGVDVWEALPGAAFAAVGWTVLARLFGIYASLAGTYTLYGALGTVFLVLTWLYLGSLLLVLGVVLNAVLAGRDTDRQLQSPGARQVSTEAMTDDATSGADVPGDERASARTRDRARDPEVLREEIERLNDRLESFEANVERRTVEKESFENELKRYVRRRVRRGHARDWGPYLVLLYGTAMSIAAFYFLAGGWAILALFVVWTSTLGLYVLMVLLGAGLSVLGVPGRIRDLIASRRS